MMLGASWGATAAERALPLACEEVMPGASVRLHRAVAIDAPPATVFRWLCQLKIAPYSYDLIDNRGRRSPRDLVPGLEHLERGQRFMSIFSLESFARDEQLTLRSRRVAVTYAVIGGGASPSGTRLLARVLFEAPAARIAGALASHALSIGDLVMMRKQLLTLKALAERDAGRAAAG